MSTKTAAYKQAMNARTIVTFGRSFMAHLREGRMHRDAGKLSAFLVATRASTVARIKKAAAAGELTLESLNAMAQQVVATRKEEDLPKNFRING